MPAIPFVVWTALGAVVAFLTPIGHHGNLLILGPGQYRFADFLRIGAPLTILLAFVCAWMTQWLWLGGRCCRSGADATRCNDLRDQNNSTCGDGLRGAMNCVVSSAGMRPKPRRRWALAKREEISDRKSTRLTLR